MIEYTRTENRDGQTTIIVDRGAKARTKHSSARKRSAALGNFCSRRVRGLVIQKLHCVDRWGERSCIVSAKPRIAILSTGDEVVAADATPGPLQIRNGNSMSLAAQVKLAGGEPVMLGNVADDSAAIEERDH